MTCPLFIELCAGTAALSLRLHHPRARPPVSRMGAKTGYADVILRCLGLRPGGQAERYLWCEPDPGVRLLLHAYRDRALAMAAADIIRGWRDEEPRALWERLRAEGPAKCQPVDAREVARNLLMGAWSFRQGQPESGFNRSEAIGHPESCKYPRDCVRISTDTESIPTLPATIADDARAVDPREVARWAWVQGHMTPIEDHRVLPAGRDSGGALAGQYNPKYQQTGWSQPHSVWLARRMTTAPTLPATIHNDARTFPTPPRLPAGTVAYIDPPYKNTTGYAAKFPRAEWLPVVRRWKDAGALVCVSEAEPIPDLMAEGWHAVRIDGERRGQKRTFSKQQAEWLTMSEPPRWKPSVQMGLFGGER